MSNNLCIHIDGEKSFFKSKTAIKRFKSDLKLTNNLEEKLELNKYFIDGVNYKLKVNDNEIRVTVYSDNSSTKNNQTKQKNNNSLKNKLRLMREKRKGKNSLLKNINKNIPSDVLQSFADLNKTFDVQVPMPNDILKNPENYKSLIQAYASRYNLTKDNKMNKLLNNYFTSLAKMLKLDYSKDNKLPSL